MQINRIANDNMPVHFGAHVVKRDKYLRSYLQGTTKTESEVKLMNKVFDAFEKHPAQIYVKPSVNSNNGLWAARGVISTKYASYQDVEPATTESGALKNILRRILDPENKKEFNTLMGNGQEKIYDSWWNENIAPIWEEISSTFRERTFFDGNYDKEFNKDFRDRKETTWYRIFVNSKNAKHFDNV